MARKTNRTINGKEYYKVTRTIGHNSDGTPIKKQFYGSGEKEARAKADAYINNIKLGFNNSITTINSLLPIWLFNVKKNEVKETTFERYEGLYRNYISSNSVANIPLNDLKAINIQKFYNTSNATDTTVKAIHKLLNSFMGYAELEGYIVKNPCKNITLPKTKKSVDEIIEKKTTKFNYFNEEDIPELISLFEGTSLQNIIKFALGTGMRKGEIFGLQWNDVDMNNRTISVKHNLVYAPIIEEIGSRKYIYMLQTPKSENSIRVIPMSDKIYEFLKGLENKSNLFVFTSAKTDTHYDIKWAEKCWTKRTKGTKFEKNSFHDLRHTFATTLLTHGANLIQLKELLGHSSVTITEIYLDALPKTKNEIINKIDCII